MNEKLIKCKYCKCDAAETYKVDDLWYVRCRGIRRVRVIEEVVDKETGEKKKKVRYETRRCNKWNPYEFLGLTEKSAIESWNLRNIMTGQGYPNKRKNNDL